jgi:hypothetical protein
MGRAGGEIFAFAIAEVLERLERDAVDIVELGVTADRGAGVEIGPLAVAAGGVEPALP